MPSHSKDFQHILKVMRSKKAGFINHKDVYFSIFLLELTFFCIPTNLAGRVQWNFIEESSLARQTSNGNCSNSSPCCGGQIDMENACTSFSKSFHNEGLASSSSANNRLNPQRRLREKERVDELPPCIVRGRRRRRSGSRRRRMST